MATRIRLKRMGRRKRPFYRIVVADSRRARDGKSIEVVGTYDPLTDPVTIRIKEENVLSWLEKGAQPSETVRQILSQNEAIKAAL